MSAQSRAGIGRVANPKSQGSLVCEERVPVRKQLDHAADNDQPDRAQLLSRLLEAIDAGD